MSCGGCRQQTKIKVSAAVILKAPILLSEGVIQFPEGQVAPQVAGYTSDESDKSRLIPDKDCACDWKITGIMLQKGGDYKPHHVCRQSKCEHGTKPVTADICKACPFRELAENSS